MEQIRKHMSIKRIENFSEQMKQINVPEEPKLATPEEEKKADTFG